MNLVEIKSGNYYKLQQILILFKSELYIFLLKDN